MNSAATIEQTSPMTRADAPVAAAPRLRIAYFTSEYPKVSHTFIRREIVELERRGHHVLRLAIRGPGTAVADAADREEAQRTVVCLNLPKLQMLAAIARAKILHPINWLRAMAMAWRMSTVSERGLFRHIVYLWEAAVLLRVCERENINHVHVHFGINCAAVARLMKCVSGGRLTYSLTVHGPDEFDAPRGLSLGEKVADASFVVAISDFCSAQIMRWSAPQHWHKIHVVHCTVGDEFYGQGRSISPASNTLLSIGRFIGAKGHLLMVDAMKRLLAEGVEAKLVFAGDGEMRSEVECAIARAGLADHVTITGWVDEATVREHLLAARALVQPSFAEGLPVVMMEALAMGRPVIATIIAGVPELVRGGVNGGENGWLITAGNTDELVAAMRDALTAPVQRLNDMGRAGRELVRQRHYTATEVARLESLFDRYHTTGGVL